MQFTKHILFVEFLLSTFVKTCFESRFHNVINVAKKWVFSTIPTNKELQMVKYTKPSSVVFIFVYFDFLRQLRLQLFEAIS